jgi:hypothetical protein
MITIQWTLRDATTSEERSGSEQVGDDVDAAFWIDAQHCDFMRAKIFGLEVKHEPGCRMLPGGQARFAFVTLSVGGKDAFAFFAEEDRSERYD